MNAENVLDFNYGSKSNYETPRKVHFSPYESNEGSIVAVAGPGFVVIASDTRLSSGFSVLSREQPKLFKLSELTIHGSAGCWCDVLTLTRVVKARMKMYLQEHNKVMSTTAVSQMLSTLLYYKRFFPYYAYNVIAGLDQDGVGWVYNYDSIGNKTESKYTAVGSSCSLLLPLLDNQIGGKNMVGDLPPMTLDKGIRIVKDVFISAAERDIYAGDGVIMNVITEDGIREEHFPLRRD